MFFLHFPGMVEQIKKVKMIKTVPLDTTISGKRNTKSHTSKTWPNEQCQNLTKEKKKKKEDLSV